MPDLSNPEDYEDFSEDKAQNLLQFGSYQDLPRCNKPLPPRRLASMCNLVLRKKKKSKRKIHYDLHEAEKK